MKILVLEDDEALRYTFSFSLSQQGFSVTEAPTLQAAERSLLAQRPDVAILDLMIGGQDSLGIANLLALLSPRTETIFVTGSNRFPNAELFQMNNYVAAVLRKPVDVRNLVDLIWHLGRCPRSKCT